MVVIVISGKPGSGSSTTANLLARKLKLKHFSMGDYYKKNIAKSKSHYIKSLTTKEGSDKNLHNKIDDMQLELAKKGDVVIESKLGIHMVGRYADIKVWLKADMDIVARRMAKQEKIPLALAKKELKSRYVNEIVMFKKIYDFNTFSQEKQADIVINTTNKSPKEVVDLIIKKIKAKGLV